MSTQTSFYENGSFINDRWLTNGPTFSVHNPANGDLIATLANATADDAQLAIETAADALHEWRKMPAKDRAFILRKWFDLIIDHQEPLAHLLTREQGKPLAEARAEIAYGASYIEWFAEEAKRVYGDTIPALNANNRILVIKQGVGVVTAITPWNFPNAMIARKAAPALAAGCTFIVKAAAETPLSALALATLAQQAGVPKGVFNVIATTHAREVGQVLTTHPSVAKFSFTGSTEVGKLLLKQCASTVKKVSMELGGNAPFIVFDDADLDAAVQGAILSKFRNAGQTCVCTNRIYVQSSVAKQFTEKFINAVKELNVGDGIDEATKIGPIITPIAFNDIAELVSSTVNEGAKIEFQTELAACTDGVFYPPTVLTGVTQSMAITQKEIFGPVAPIIEFSNEQDAITMANDSNVGLASYIYTRDIGRIWRVSEALEYGMVGVNEGIISNAAAPFGGMKESGIGREGSKYGLDDYLEIKYLCLGGINN